MYNIDFVDDNGEMKCMYVVSCDECGRVVDIVEEVDDIGCGYVCCYWCGLKKRGLEKYKEESVGYNYLVEKKNKLVDEDGFEFEKM